MNKQSQPLEGKIAGVRSVSTYVQLLVLLTSLQPCLFAQQKTVSKIELSKDTSGIAQMVWVDQHSITARNYIDDNKALGILNIKYQLTDKKSIIVSTKDSRPTLVQGKDQLKLTYQLPGQIKLIQEFVQKAATVSWNIIFVNNSGGELILKDLSFPLPIGKFDKKRHVSENINAHSSITSNASFCYWIPYSGSGNILLMTMSESTSLEYQKRSEDGNEFFIHASSSIDLTNDSWRIPATSAAVPKGKNKAYGFKFQLANSLDEIRELLYRNDGLDVRIAPGMTVPSDLAVTCALKTKGRIAELITEFPAETEVTYLGAGPQQYQLYRLKFKRRGENLVTVQYGDGKKAYLNFFSTEPLEVLIKKRSAFIVSHQQIRDTSKWYDGLFGVWDMEAAKLTTPDDKGPLPDFVVGGSDDPSNCKPLYISEKNVVYPDRNEIAALEYYEQHFVWGGLQRKDDEYPYPYGIYGSENWFENRSGKVAGYNSGGWGKERMWRTFDYTTHFAIYFNLYRIASNNPKMVSYLNADQYLERAYGTAMAFFNVPYNIKMGERWSFHGWTDWAYKQGNFHERYITEIIAALKENNQLEKAGTLEREWVKKVKYFIYDDPWPFASEFEIDRTAFESSYYVAAYAKEHPLQPQEQLWYDKNKQIWYSHLNINDSFTDVLMKKQLEANLALRGTLEPSFNLLGTAWASSYGLDYMSQMGGVPILDYAIRYSTDRPHYVNIGYTSLLSSWALMNTGTEASGYGYWYPNKRNDGAVGWIFTPWQHSTMYFKNIPAKRGVWKYDGEIDHGLTAAIHGSSSIVLEDPVFGLVGYGCEIIGNNTGNIIAIPKDGVGRKFHSLLPGKTISFEILTDGLLKGAPIKIDQGGKRFGFSIENRQGSAHVSSLVFQDMEAGQYEVYAGDKLVAKLEVESPQMKNNVKIHLVQDRTDISIIKR